MTREEAIKWLQTALTAPFIYGEYAEAIDMAINALAVCQQYKWERDVAIEQLEEYGIGFAEKKRDMVEVVRCKECKNRARYAVCDYLEEDGFCPHGERRKP